MVFALIYMFLVFLGWNCIQWRTVKGCGSGCQTSECQMIYSVKGKKSLTEFLFQGIYLREIYLKELCQNKSPWNKKYDKENSLKWNHERENFTWTFGDVPE